MSAGIIYYCILVFCVNLITLKASLAESVDYRCNSREIATKARAILQNNKSFIIFCSNCSPEKAKIRQVKIQAGKKISHDTPEETVSLQLIKEEEGCFSISATGTIIRGVKPPVFGGYCTDILQVYNPSIALEIPYQHKLNLANVYLWNPEKREFQTLAEMVGLDTSDICIKRLILNR